MLNLLVKDCFRVDSGAHTDPLGDYQHCQEDGVWEILSPTDCQPTERLLTVTCVLKW